MQTKRRWKNEKEVLASIQCFGWTVSIDFSDDSLSIEGWDYRQGGGIIRRKFDPIRQNEVDREVFSRVEKYVKDKFPNSADHILSLLSTCDWATSMNLEDKYEIEESLFAVVTREKRSFDDIQYEMAYIGDSKEDVGNHASKYGNTSGKGNFMHGTGKFYEISKILVDGEEYLYHRLYRDWKEPNKKAPDIEGKFTLLDLDDLDGVFKKAVKRLLFSN